MPTVPKLSSGGTSTSVVKTTTKTAAPIAPQVNLATPGTTTTVRRGDYLYTYRNGVLISTKYAPTYVSTGRATTGVTSGPAVSQLQSGLTQRQTTSPPVNIVRSSGTGSSSAAGGSGMAQTAPNTYTDGLYGGTGGGVSIGGGGGTGVVGGGGSIGGVGQNLDMGKPWGWTVGMDPTNVQTAVDSYPERILSQVMGQNLSLTSPQFLDFMSRTLAAANNPFTQLLMNSGIGPKNPTTGHDQYNFQANLLKNMVTPGGGFADLGAALRALQGALGDNSSSLYNILLGSSAGKSGADAIDAQVNTLKSMLAPILELSGSNLMQLITSSMLNNLARAYGGTTNFADPNQNVVEYIMRGLGYPGKFAPMPGASSSGAANIPVLGAGLGGL